MKKIILILVALIFAFPSIGLSIQEFKRTGKIDMDEHGGYADQQRDHHSRRSKQIKAKSGSGYYDGSFHSKTDNFKPGEWQFVGAGQETKKQKKKKK